MPSLRTTLLSALLLLMELLPSFVLLVGTSLFEATTWGYALFWFLVLVGLAGEAWGFLLAHLRWQQRRHRASVILGGALIAGVPSMLGANGIVAFLSSFILLGIAFWRGLAVTIEAPSHDEAQRRFAYGFGILFFGILWVIARGIINQRQVWQMLAEAGIAFIVVSMLTLVTARVAHERERGTGGAIALAVVLQLGGLLLLSFLALQLFALDVVGQLGHSLQPFFDAVGRHLFSWLGYIADPIDRFVSLIRPHSTHGAHLAPPIQPANDAYGRRPKYHPPVHSPLVAIAALLVIAAMLAGIGYAIWRAVPRVQVRLGRTRPYREERRSLVSISTLWRTLIASLRRLFRRGTKAAGAALSQTRRRVWGPTYPDDPVRKTYAQMLHRARGLGFDLRATSTPLELQEQLTVRWPGGMEGFDRLTAAYIRRRYGEFPVHPHELSALRTEWQLLRHAMTGLTAPRTHPSSSRTFLATMMAPPEHERPALPRARARGAFRRTEAAHSPWPADLTLVVLSITLAVVVVIGFVVIFALAGGRLG